MTIDRPRATGYYALFLGREYHATIHGSDVILRSYRGEPEAAGLIPSRIPIVQGIRQVKRSTLEHLSFVRTVCRWKGEPFLIVGVEGELLNVFYTGNRGEWAVRQPGMVRTGKLECHGRLLISDVEEVYEFVDPLPL
ncbi:hypothetical protein [Mycolicibacterium sp. HK-90]|uniref:hypothetical protein n=1 Tax=Mycolicibacterium sp. HK-90 TaxID=3056937 RepID=UPI002658B2C1|nr:hypothetical protein [Mycolicibacterium sp. HK-90]WKG03654.1 hypothetical protein QU592_00425 [Mycolicibacterium sp. HK-90]